MLESVFQYFGQFSIMIVTFIAVLLIIALVLGIAVIKKDVLIFPRLILFVTEIFYSPLKWLTKLLGFDDNLVDHIGVLVRNRVNKNDFNNISNKDKALVLPHCLRHPDCNAKLAKTGLICNDCNKCAIGVIKAKAEEEGYQVFIVPGSTFIKKIAKENQFKSVLGVACYEDLNLAMMKLSKFSPQGVVLSRDGCYKTKVDVKTVLDTIKNNDIKNNTPKVKCNDSDISNINSDSN
ncbi:MAG: DUF116 domain-containing protein [Methanobacteriaceae archaeon]